MTDQDREAFEAEFAKLYPVDADIIASKRHPDGSAQVSKSYARHLAFKDGWEAARAQPAQEPVAEVVMAAKPGKASDAWLPHKTIYAPLPWIDAAPVGTKLYTATTPRAF